jgi:GntR family transcriptional regulator
MPDPKWLQIAQALRDKIESGEIGSDGEPLPSESDLGETYGVSRNTIRGAMNWLVNHRLVEPRPGQGTFIRKIDPVVTTLSTKIGSGPGAESATYLSEAKDINRIGSVSKPRIEIQSAAETEVADELQLEPDDTVVIRHQQRFIDGVAWSLQTTFYSMSFVDRGATELIQAKDMPDGTVRYLAEKLGIKEIGWRDLFKVRAPDRNETAFFELPEDGRIAVVEIVRTGYDDSGKPFRVTRTTYPADRNQFTMTAGTVPGTGGQAADQDDR